jgi:hypothetical protein
VQVAIKVPRFGPDSEFGNMLSDIANVNLLKTFTTRSFDRKRHRTPSFTQDRVRIS